MTVSLKCSKISYAKIFIRNITHNITHNMIFTQKELRIFRSSYSYYTYNLQVKYKICKTGLSLMIFLKLLNRTAINISGGYCQRTSPCAVQAMIFSAQRRPSTAAEVIPPA